jgi:hypothetical protein
LWSVFVANSAIVTSPSNTVASLDATRKEKRGTFGAYGHHAYEHFDDLPAPYHHHHHSVGPAPVIPPPPQPPVHLGAHAHTTVVKKVGIPVHVPYPVRVITKQLVDKSIRLLELQLSEII